MRTTDEDLNQLEKDVRQLKIDYEQYFGGGRSRPPTDTEWRIEQILKRYSDRGPDMTFPQRFRFNGLAQTYAKWRELFHKRVKQKEEGVAPRPASASAKAPKAEPAVQPAGASAAPPKTKPAAPPAGASASAKAPKTAPAAQPASAGASATPPKAKPAVQPASASVSAQPPKAKPAAQPASHAERAAGEPLFTVVCADPDRETRQVEQLYRAYFEAKRKAGESTEQLTLVKFTEFLREKSRQFREQKGTQKIEYAVTQKGGKVRLVARLRS